MPLPARDSGDNSSGICLPTSLADVTVMTQWFTISTVDGAAAAGEGV